MQEMKILTIGDNQYEIVDAAARAAIPNAGKVKSINGIAPDDAGNVTITIPDPDLTNYYTKEELDVKLGELEDIADQIIG